MSKESCGCILKFRKCSRYVFCSENGSFIMMLFLTSSFFFVELFVGYRTNSMALVADSFHMLSDLISLGIGFFSLCVSERKLVPETLTYGWSRVDILGALTNCVFLFSLCLSITAEAIERIIYKESIENPYMIMIVGGCGLAINIIGIFIFQRHSGGCCSHKKHHELEPSNQVLLLDMKEERDSLDNVSIKIKNSADSEPGKMNLRGVVLHIIGDMFGSIVVMISCIVFIVFKGQDWTLYIDPFMSLILVLILLKSCIPLMLDSARILLLHQPKKLNKEKMKKKILAQFPCIREIHSFYVWNVTGNINIANLHIRFPNIGHYLIHVNDIIKLFHVEGIHNVTISPEFNENKELDDGKVCMFTKLGENRYNKITNDVNDEKSIMNCLRQK